MVIEQNGKAVTDSLKIAEVFGKDHDKVIRDIRNLDCSEEFSTANFGESNYVSERGRTYTKYFITHDGFTFLVMGYNGKDAAMYKESYIREFNHMRDQLALKNPANDYLNMSDEDRAIAYFMKLKAEKELLLLAEQNKPLVTFAETVLKSEDTILVRDMAKVIKEKG
ncbi:Rha family transcriptional regulator [Paenibacillus sp. FSL H8-0332]|uniref:Rha family transcriptional regulator n=1 Tax=Paenibacillus sp. FSL H8-0332 TaxID=2954742 RepID=UPI0030D20398